MNDIILLLMLLQIPFTLFLLFGYVVINESNSSLLGYYLKRSKNTCIYTHVLLLIVYFIPMLIGHLILGFIGLLFSIFKD